MLVLLLHSALSKLQTLSLGNILQPYLEIYSFYVTSLEPHSSHETKACLLFLLALGLRGFLGKTSCLCGRAPPLAILIVMDHVYPQA
jgi:hypothetical protein